MNLFLTVLCVLGVNAAANFLQPGFLQGCAFGFFLTLVWYLGKADMS